jgi:hypothetical protein
MPRVCARLTSAGLKCNTNQTSRAPTAAAARRRPTPSRSIYSHKVTSDVHSRSQHANMPGLALDPLALDVSARSPAEESTCRGRRCVSAAGRAVQRGAVRKREPFRQREGRRGGGGGRWRRRRKGRRCSRPRGSGSCSCRRRSRRGHTGPSQRAPQWLQRGPPRHRVVLAHHLVMATGGEVVSPPPMVVLDRVSLTSYTGARGDARAGPAG